MPQLSVITACYQHGRYLAECMASVQAQRADIEHVIIIDGATDNSETVAVLNADANTRVIVNKENVGLAASQNIGIEAALSPWVLKVDADDYIDKTYAVRILGAAADDPRRNVIFSPAHIFGATVDRVYRYKPFVAAEMIDHFMIPGPSAIRKDLWAAVGGYDETMRSGEDWDLYVRAQVAVGLTPHQLEDALWHYRQHNGVRASEHGMQRIDYLKTYWRGHTRETVAARSRTWGAWCAERKVAA